MRCSAPETTLQIATYSLKKKRVPSCTPHLSRCTQTHLPPPHWLSPLLSLQNKLVELAGCLVGSALRISLRLQEAAGVNKILRTLPHFQSLLQDPVKCRSASEGGDLSEIAVVVSKVIWPSKLPPCSHSVNDGSSQMWTSAIMCVLLLSCFPFLNQTSLQF